MSASPIRRARRPRRLAVAAAVAAASWLTAAHLAHADSPVKSMLELRRQNVVVQQFDLSCGAAALATLLDFQFGLHLSEKQVAQGLISRKEYIEHPELIRIREGFSLLDMKRYVTSLGLMGIGYGKLDLEDIIKLAPIIVPVSPIGYNHFVIFRGRIGDHVLLADPAFGNRTMSTAKFERIWINFPSTGRVGFIVSRDGNPAPPGLLSPGIGRAVTPPAALVRAAVFD